MRKKVLIMIVCLLSSFTVVCLYINKNLFDTLKAQTVSAFQLKKGQKIILGTYEGRELVWDIGNNNNNGNSVLMSSKPLVDNLRRHVATGVQDCLNRAECTVFCQAASGSTGDVNGTCTANLESRGAYGFRYDNTILNSKMRAIILNAKETDLMSESFFIPSYEQIKNNGTLGFGSLEERAYKSDTIYFLNERVNSKSSASDNHWGYKIKGLVQVPVNGAYDSNLITSLNVSVASVDGMRGQFDYYWSTSQTDGPTIGSAALRPFAKLNNEKINFAADTSYTDGSWHAYVIDTSNWNANNEVNANKLRIQSALTASLQDIKYKSESIDKITENKSIELSINANTGTSSKISVLLYNESGTEIKYYRMLTDTLNGTNDYTLDLTDVAVGKYQLAIINEEYDASSNLPVESSPISNTLPLEIVEPHKLSYTKAPESGAGSGKDYEFSKNVNKGQTVGTISVNPQGIVPLTYTVETNGDNTYQNFELDGLNDDNESSNKSLNVKIKDDGPDLVDGGLKAGTYNFCISATDANGDPETATSDSKVCTSFTVEKTNTKVVFDDTNITKKSISDESWNETATATPETGTKVTYSISGGDTYLINIDSDTGEITNKGSGAFGKVKIKATVDDDPDTGDDNYNPADTEKEIVIYRDVDGDITPDKNSSNINVPTFTASDANIKIGGTIGTVKGKSGTPDNLSSGTTTYTYGIKSGEGDANFFSVDKNSGIIKSTANLGVSENGYSITVTVSDKWSTKEIPVKIYVGVAAAEDLKFYENSTSDTVINKKSVKSTDTDVSVFATVKGSKNTNPVTYKIKDGSTNIIEINPNNGKITVHEVGTVTIVAEKQGAVGQANASTELTFTVTAGEQSFIYTDSTLSNELPKGDSGYSTFSETYEPGKTLQLYTTGNPTGSTVTYKLKDGSPTDVIAVDESGEITILNASISPSQIGKVIVEATSHDPSGNFSDKIIELPIDIPKAKQAISFKEITYVANGKGSVAPVIIDQDISSNAGGANVSDTDYYISVDTSVSNNIAYSNDGKTIYYEYKGEEGIDIPLHVVKQGNRNYEKVEADGVLHIMGPDENILATTNLGKIVYGDHFEIRSLQDDSSSTNVQYQFEVDNTAYISNPTVSGNKAEFDALKAGDNTNITIQVTRTAEGETPLSKAISVQVLPKEIEIIIDNKEKLKGELNPSLTYQDFRSQLVSWNDVQDIIQEKDIKLSTTAKADSNAGNYPIKGDANGLNKIYSNYSFKFKEGTIAVKEENIEDDWYHLELNDENNTAYTGDWTNKDVNIISDHSEYVNISLDLSTWKPNLVTVSKEGESNQGFWMKKDNGAITKEKQEIIKIDKTAPKIKGIKAKDTNNKLQDIINKLSGGIFFKTGTAFEITTDDSKADLKVSGTKEISYKVYKLDTVARAGEELIKEGTLTVNNEKANITIGETTGKYKVCVILTDNAGNTNSESCHEVTLKKIDVDVDKDGKPDFNDPDGDGCPDLNIVLGKDEDGFDIKLNIDNNRDGIPELNIDTDGDGKPDINVDLDGDGKADLNIATNIKWNPTYCVTGQIDEYCTDQNVIPDINIDLDGDGRPDINIDLDNDGIPDVDIDIDGDGKPDINIDTNRDGKPDEKLKNLNEWNPDEIFTVNGKKYQTMTNITLDNDEPSKSGNENPSQDNSNTSVKGSYNPGNNEESIFKYNIGGASTGDNTNLMLHLGSMVLGITAISYLLYRYKKDIYNKI